MFGSKLRSWMENHIVRPRKKGNKNNNKNTNSNVSPFNVTPAAGCSHELYKKPASSGLIIHHGNGNGSGNGNAKGNTTNNIGIASSVPIGGSFSSNGVQQYNGNGGVGSSGGGGGGCSSVISSPVRRREVSPIQNHTQSRYGWQSPDQETVTSPKSDNFLYAPQHQRVRATHYSRSHTAPPSKENSSEDKSTQQSQPQSQLQSQPQQQQLQHPADCSSSSISSLSWSTGSKEPSMQSANNSHAKTSAVPSIEIHTQPLPQVPARNTDFRLEENEEDDNVVHYEEIRTILRHPESFANNNIINCESERPKSEQLTTFVPHSRTFQETRRSQDDASTRYGRLLPSRIQSQDVTTYGGGSTDNLNGNHLRHGGSSSAECIPSAAYHHRSGRIHSGVSTPSAGTVDMYSYHDANISTAVLTHTHRTGRFRQPSRCGGQQTPLGSVGAPLGHSAPPLHSLSSPESAYSTGYSTDGTSPGAIYTPPEYYINMRTGTHYFPKSVNSLAIEAQRYKFGLNKIEEMSPIDPLPKTSFANVSSNNQYGHGHGHGHAHVKLPNFGASPKSELQPQAMHTHSASVGCHSPLAIRNPIILPTLKGFESPSPRQRCRIRTNPWYSTTDTSSSGATIAAMQTSFPPPVSASSTISSSMSSACSSVLKMELDAASTSSSGIKSSNEAGIGEEDGRRGTHSGSENKQHHHQHQLQLQRQPQQPLQQNNEKTSYESSESSSSLTEVENMKRTYSPNTIKRKRSELLHSGGRKESPVANAMLMYTVGERVGGGGGTGVYHQDIPASDDDATLNEMMGKFDESYVYEKETDILSSDSDLTDCPSDLDTGQDAGDECDTDELLDIDFIDNASIQEVFDRKDSVSNLGNCFYYNNNSNHSNNNNSPTRFSRIQISTSVRSRKGSRSMKTHPDAPPGSAGSQRRRKRFLKTRKKSSEGRENCTHNSPVHKPRESRSVGGTPVSLRKHHSIEKRRIYKTSPLSNRSSSLVFTDVREQRFMTIAESERALLKADLEADVKYRQLILEAESLLVTMKSSMHSIPRETPFASPRRVNPLANKRVEMLKNCESDTKRDLSKQQPQRSLDSVSHAEQELAAAIHRRIELLKYESNSAPNSPKSGRCSPRKTHLTNFINQNIPPEVPVRKSHTQDHSSRAHSPQLQLNGHRLSGSPKGSPASRRRFRSHSPRLSAPERTMGAESDSEQESRSYSYSKYSSRESFRNLSYKRSAEDVANCNYLPEIAKITLYDGADIQNRNMAAPLGVYCPQSEPLKRKVYKGSSTFERIKKSFDLDSEIPKRAMLAKISLLRRERQHSTAKLLSPKSSSHDLNQSYKQAHSSASKLNFETADEEPNSCSSSNSKKQLILNTIADLKRSLENQSVELSGLNEEA